ncbi:PDZ-binding protein [Babesia duncani]|uniref:Cysteine-rich PDZ-binding protein n=1 Tax=Babesia duncani TaxID=323732 RepID=A0AAD9PNV3_9APIC|nr:PDZ-binding protein [Babesia duncani]
MPCKNCERKLGKLATPDVKSDGNRCSIGVHKLIEKRCQKDKMEAKDSKCKGCKAFLHVKAKYCISCAYKKGKCHICGRKIMDVSRHTMSLV